MDLLWICVINFPNVCLFVYSKDVRLPVQLQRAMAAEAEAAREARAKVKLKSLRIGHNCFCDIYTSRDRFYDDMTMTFTVVCVVMVTSHCDIMVFK